MGARTSQCYQPSSDIIGNGLGSGASYLNKSSGLQLLVISTAGTATAWKFRRGGTTYQDVGRLAGVLLMNPGDGYRVDYVTTSPTMYIIQVN